jgi:ribonuclease P protein component
MMQVKDSTTKPKVERARLKKRRDFLRIQRGGFKVRGRFLVVMSRPKFPKAPIGHFGIVAPKALGKAHDRNFVKRRLRHLVSLNPEILQTHDIVILATTQSIEASFEDLKTDIVQASLRLKSQPARSFKKAV